MADEERHEETRETPEGGLSRRSFLRGTASAGVAGLLAGRAAAQEEMDGEAPRTEHGVPVLGPGPVPVRLTVNGRVREIEVEPRVTLLDALRQRLELTGAKRVCDRGTCGACTVLLDGRPVYACSVLAVAAQGAEIETVESLGESDDLHPLQAAFVENDAQQCGFCTPGFVVASKALLDRVPDPTPEQVIDGLSGNFCRCGTYDGVKRAVAETAKGGRRG